MKTASIHTHLENGGALQHSVDALAERHVQNNAFGSFDLCHHVPCKKNTSWRSDTRSSLIADRIREKSMAVPLSDAFFDIGAVWTSPEQK